MKITPLLRRLLPVALVCLPLIAAATIVPAKAEPSRTPYSAEYTVKISLRSGRFTT